jgi:hypothetical protein
MDTHFVRNSVPRPCSTSIPFESAASANRTGSNPSSVKVRRNHSRSIVQSYSYNKIHRVLSRELTTTKWKCHFRSRILLVAKKRFLLNDCVVPVVTPDVQECVEAVIDISNSILSVLYNSHGDTFTLYFIIKKWCFTNRKQNSPKTCVEIRICCKLVQHRTERIT